MVNFEVLEKKGKQAVFYQVLTLHRTLTLLGPEAFHRMEDSIVTGVPGGGLGAYRQNEVQTHYTVTSP